MSGNIALRNRRRREHAAHTGGRTKSSRVVNVDVTVPLSGASAEARARTAVRDVTGIDLEDASGSIALGTFSALVVELDVEEAASGSQSQVRVALRTVPRNSGLALFMLALLVLSIVGIVIYALRTKGRPDDDTKLKAMAAKLEAAILSSR